MLTNLRRFIFPFMMVLIVGGSLWVSLLISPVRAKQEIAISDKIRLKDAQLRAERALTALLQTQQYAALQAASAEAAAILADIEKRAGCKIDPAIVECVTTK